MNITCSIHVLFDAVSIILAKVNYYVFFILRGNKITGTENNDFFYFIVFNFLNCV